MSALPPSAAMVNAARQMDCAPSGNARKSLRAALIQEIARVFGTISFRQWLYVSMLSYLTTTPQGRIADNMRKEESLQEAGCRTEPILHNLSSPFLNKSAGIMNQRTHDIARHKRTVSFVEYGLLSA